MYMESIPLGLGGALRFLNKLAPGSMERVNISVQKQIEKGKEIINNAGGIQGYNSEARKKKGPITPKLELQGEEQIVFE